MKKIYLIPVLTLISVLTNAQVFWTENFTSGGVGWNLLSVTGLNGADPNFWKVSDDEGGGLIPNLGVGNNIPGTILCSCGIGGNGNNTMHITSVFNPTGGASYDAGGLCGILFCPLTNVRAESPTINCTGKINISVNFNYIENGQNTIDDGTLWYFDGITWAQIDNMPKTLTGCGGQGLWTSRTIALPASANNNANVKIGYKWVNNDDGAGTDPSIAIDDITLSTPTTTSTISFSLTLPSPICQSNTISATFASTATPTSFTWSATSPNVVFTPANSGTTSISFTAPGTYTVSLTACQGTVCGTATSSIQVIATPTINFTASPTVVCVPGSSTLTVTGGPSTTSYTWSASQGPAITNTNIAVVSPTSNTTYTVLTSIPGCTTSISFNVPVSPNPTITVTPNSSICNGQTINLVSAGGATYSWTPSTSLNTSTGGNVIASPTITTTYIVTGNNGVCSNTAAVTVTVGASTTVSVTPTNSTICLGQSANIVASGGSTYSWTASSGANPASIANISVSPTVTTTYTVLTGTGSCTAQAVSTISVAPAFTLTVTPSATTICNAALTNIVGSGGVTYTWSPAAGLNTTSGANVVANPSITTTYSVLSSNGVCTNSAIATVSVIVVSTSVVATSANYCLGGTPVTLTGSGATTYSWSPATGLSSTSGAVVSATPTITTTYSLTGTSGPCSSNTVITITVPTPSSLTIVASSTLICAGGSAATLTALGGTTYTWQPGVNTTSVNIVNPATTTIYTLTGQTATGCLAIPAIVTVSISPSVTPTLSASSTSVCLTKTITLSALPTGAGLSYTWTPSSAILGATNTASVIAKPTTTGSIVYTLTISNGLCSKTATISITAFNCTPPVADFTTFTNDSICTGGCVSFSNTTTGTQPIAYQWLVPGATPPSSTSSDPQFCFFAPGEYTVVLIAKNAFGSDTIIKFDYINVADTPAVVTAFGDTLIKIGQTAPIYATGATNYYWTPNNGSVACPTCSATIAQPTVTTQYIVIGSNSPYCSRQDTIVVKVDFTCGDFFVPNAFSPNNDGKNDFINVHGFCISTYNLQIYNRWGELVFATSDLTNSWDGTYRGKPMDTGVFVYRADGITIDGRSFNIKGNITLIR
jgi:gliding motility-associated-like protein